MKRALALVVVMAMLVALAPSPAHAHGAAGAALALGAFAVFNALFLPFAIASAVVAPAYYPPAYYAAPAPVYAPAAPAYYAPSYAPARTAAAPLINREVVYPHGRYILYGDGVSSAYRWVWVPNPPPPGSAPVR
ncbi:MAG TPA: hypothetical protein VFL90_15580 [Methylomirabilota bacterium]|nr:hypothetical protein [Methylomirabilota bacterium]